TLGFPRERIHVAYPPVDPVFTRDGPRAEGDYVLTVGTLEPRKNLALAIDGVRDRELRVVGARGWGGVEARGDHVTWLGDPEDAELARQYTRARGARHVA